MDEATKQLSRPNEMLTSFPTNEGQQGNADTVEEAELEDLLAQE